jgi:hypothetical protein
MRASGDRPTALRSEQFDTDMGNYSRANSLQWNTEAYDIPSALGSNENNGPWPFILGVLKRLGRS